MKVSYVSLALAALSLAVAGPASAQSPELAAALKFEPFMAAISVADMEAETNWYVDKLGFTVTADTKIGGGTPIRWLENGGQRIELIQAAGSVAGPARATPPRHAGIRGFAQLALETPDLQATRDALKALGVTIVLDITEVAPLGIKVIYLLDPEGNAIEIAQRLPK